MRTNYFDLSEQIAGYELPTQTIDGKRHYITPSGKAYPSVTTVLSTMNSDAIQKWRDKVGHEEATKISTQAAKRGTAVHLIAERYLRNEDDYLRDAMPVNVDSFKPIQQYLDKWCDKVYANEISLYSDELRTAGRCDMIGRIHGVRTIGDFKTARKAKQEQYILNYFYQCTAYALMLYERCKLWSPQICVMIATDTDGLQVFLKRTNEFVPQVREFFDLYHAEKRPVDY
jgi:genome maintenance exonuclease 1